MAGVELKIRILRKSLSTFSSWLDDCDQLLTSIPTELEQCSAPELRELALKYKDLLLQLKERGLYMQEMNSLCKEVTTTTPPQHLDITRDVRELNKRFAKACLEAKQYYSKLSDSLALVIANQESVQSFHLITLSPKHGQQKVKPEAKGHLDEAPSISNKAGIAADYERRNKDENFEVISLERSPVVGRGHKGHSGRMGVQAEGREVKAREQEKGEIPSSEKTPKKPQEVSAEAVDGADLQDHLVAVATSSRDNSSSEGGNSPRQNRLKVAKVGSLKPQRPLVPPKSSSLRQKLLAEKELASKGESENDSEMDKQLESLDKLDTVSVHSTHSLHSLQNRIINATDTTSVHSTESLEHLRTSDTVDVGAESGFQEATTNKDNSRLCHTSADSEPNASSFLAAGHNGSEPKTRSECKTEEEWRLGSVDSLQLREMLEGKGMEEGSRSASSPVDLSTRLRDMSFQIEDFVHSIAEHRKCGLQSLSLELHLGEMKAMLALLEVQELELDCLRASFSPSAQQRLAEEKEKRKGITIQGRFPVYPNHEISANRDEILKLSERVELLYKHCSETVTQTEEVLEFVMQYEGEVKGLKDFLTGVRGSITMVTKGDALYSDDSWMKLREALTAVNDQKTQLSSIEQLSTHLLYLETIFDGDPVRQELQVLSKSYQSLILEIFKLLEGQARGRTEQLLLEVSVLSSWVTEAELSLQVLTKRTRKPNGMTTKLAATRESLSKELEKRKSSLLTISEKLQPITAVLSPDDHQSLRDLLFQVERNTKYILQIENGLKAIEIGQKSYSCTSSTGRPPLQLLDMPPVQNGWGHQTPPVPKSAGQDTRSSTPPGLYATLDEVKAPPSPLVEYEQLPSEALDSAIARLPCPPALPPRPPVLPPCPPSSSFSSSSPCHTQRRDRYATIDLYDHPRALGRVTLHEELLRFISQEWAGMPTETPLDEAALQKAISCLGSAEVRSSCQRFILSLRTLETDLRGVAEQISLVKIPQVPDLEKVHSIIDQCQRLKERLEKLHHTLEHHNEETLTLLTSLGNRPPGARVTQLLEIRLFDASTLWHSSNLQVASKLSGLRQKEGDVNSLHRQLQTITKILGEARELLEVKQQVLDVGKFLSRCKEMHQKLLSLSEQRSEVSSEVRKSMRPQSPVCQRLLDQLNQVDTQWSDIMTNLSQMSIQEPVLIKQMLTNIAKELGDIESALPGLSRRGLDLEEVEGSWHECQAYLPKAREFHSTLNCTKYRLQVLKSSFSNLDLRKEHFNGSERLTQPTLQGHVSGAVQSGITSVQNGVSSQGGSVGRDPTGVGANQQGVNGSASTGNKVYVEMMITPCGPELAPIDYNQLTESCETAMRRADQLISELETLVSILAADRSLLSPFYQELRDLQLWLRDTKEIIAIEDHSHIASGSSLVRGKRQAICQQVVTRQARLEALQSLAADVMLLPSSKTEREGVEKKLSALYRDWDEICTQCVPAGVLPLVSAPSTETSSNFQAPPEFEDVMQMIEWLILIESKLQPEKITVGDFVQLRRLLRDIQLIERELKLKEKDYKKFMKGAFPPESSIPSNSVSPDIDSSISKLQSQVQMLIDEAKCVKFSDENTLERKRRRKEISVETHPETGSGLELLELEDSSEISWKYAVHSGIEHQPFGLEQEGQERASIISSSSSLQFSSPSSLMPDELYQLFILWNGVWTTLNQRCQGLETVQDVWRAFESRKELFSNFLVKAEERMASFFKVMSSAKDLTVMQAEVTTQKSFTDEVHAYEQRLATLNDLSHDLITHHHSNDNTDDLQETMNDLNTRWKKVMESYSLNQPTINAVCSRWHEFYQQYQSLQQWLRTMDVEMSNLNPFVNDMAAVRLQLEKQKEIQQELISRDGVMDAMRLQVYKLLQGVGGGHINAAAIHSKLENMGRRWDHLQKLAQERKSALEQALSEKQDLLSRIADCLSWLKQAEKHLASQKPLGCDYYSVHAQHTAHQCFQVEVQEQKPKMEAVILAGKQTALETQWSQGTPAKTTLDNLRVQYGTLEERWRVVSREAEEWGTLLENVHPEMEKFQALCTKCGQKLSEAEMQAAKFEPVARKMHLLNHQLEALQSFETMLLSLSDILESIVVSQKLQLQMNVQVSPDLMHLVRSYHQRWTDLQQKTANRHSIIKKALVKNNPANWAFAPLPPGWHRAQTEKGTPYYINTNAGNKAQWQHPDLSLAYEQLQSFDIHTFYPSPAYPIALKLRAVQKRTQLSLLQTRHAMEAFEEYQCHPDPDRTLSCTDMTALAVDMFQHAQEDPWSLTDRLHLNKAVELTTCWLRDVYDVSHAGSISCLCFQIGTICMSQGKLDEKYKSLFNVISGNRSTISLNQLTKFLEQVIQIPQSVCETQFCSLHSADLCAKDCFRNHAGSGALRVPQFVAWLQTEPYPLAWLLVLQRMIASETAQHSVKCGVCRNLPIVGFRYHCLQCKDFDMCQECNWSGKTGKGHDRSKHFMEEYCVSRTPGEDVKVFFRSLQRSFHKKKKMLTDQTESFEPTQVGGGDLAAADTPPSPRGNRKNSRGSPPARKRHSTLCSVSIGDSPITSSQGNHIPSQRRFTASDEVTSQPHKGSGLKLPSPPPLRRSTVTGRPPIPPRVPPKPARKRPPQQQGSEGAAACVGDLDTSLSKLTVENIHLSERLQGLRRHRSSSSPPSVSPPGGWEPSPEKQLKARTSYLQGRVQHLQQHNTQLQSCINQLRAVATMRQVEGAVVHLPPPPPLILNGQPPVLRSGPLKL